MSGTMVDTADGTMVVIPASVSTSDKTAALAAVARAATAVSLYMARARYPIPRESQPYGVERRNETERNLMA